MGIIKTEGLTYTYGIGTPFEKTAVEDISIDIEAGEIVGIIGHTGSGKSTLIQHFNGLLKPSSGKIYINGIDIWEDKKNIRNARFTVGLVFQYPEHQIFEETVYKDISFGPKNMGLDKNEIDERVREITRNVGLTEDMLNKSPFELSGGQKRRVAIAGVMAMKPKILVLDEPAAGLDPKGREKIFSLIENYHKNTGSTVLIVSHSMEDIALYSKKILVMNKGKVFCYDTVGNVFKRADELTEIGLAVPQITRVMNRLDNGGINLDLCSGVFSVGRAKEILLNYLSKQTAGEKN